MRRTFWISALLVGATLGAASEAVSQVAPPVEAAEPDRGDWVVFPFLFYTPETRLGGGAVAGNYRRLSPGAAPSSFIGSLTVTARRQLIVEFVPDLYLAGGTRLDGEIRFRHYPDVFYGVGPGTTKEAEEEYTSRMMVARARMQRPVRPGLRIGLEGRVRRETLVEVQEGGALEEGEIAGSEGGLAVALGPVLTWDTRDSRFSTRSGRYLELSWSIDDPFLGSDFGFHSLRLDLRHFLPLGARSEVGIQGYLDVTTGDPPFTLLPALGGQDRMRGFREGRFRDRTMATAQGELRFPIWWRIEGVAFAGVGGVGRSLGELSLSDLEPAGGAGLRYRLTEEGVVLRADFAVASEGTGLYLTLGQAF